MRLFVGDLPRIDRPLPRFLDDAGATGSPWTDAAALDEIQLDARSGGRFASRWSAIAKQQWSEVSLGTRSPSTRVASIGS